MGRRYNYFYHPYGSTWKNERAVEIPIVWDIVKTFIEKNKKILEVGNVLSYRFKVKSENYDILDKYEIKNSVIKEDIVDFKSQYKFDLIVCISTLEHIGWDEDFKDTTKVLRAVDNMRSMVAPGGKMIVTIPLGYNPELDASLRTKKIQFKAQFYMERTGNLQWKQVDYNELKEIEYDFNIPSARGLIIAIDEN